MSGKTEKMRAVKDEVVSLTNSPLYAYRTEHNYFPVIGEGSHDAAIMFVGEAPGKNEAETGRPFCGAAGRVLDELLTGAGLAREEVYITNIVKDRPPGNRDPMSEEIALYAPFLERQIDIIRPQVVATLGRFSMQYLLERFGTEQQGGSISQLHGTLLYIDVGFGPTAMMPLYHPAVALYKASMKEELAKDFKKLKEVLR